MIERALLVLGLLGCSSEAASPLFPADGPVALRGDCELASRRCSRCHALDRITHSSFTDPFAWRRYVHRMRLMPASAIPDADEAPIVRCLVYRTSGRQGLALLSQELP